VRVSSPIGDLPFTPTSMHVSRDGLDIDGAMGAWPAHVHVDATDLPVLARLLPRRAIVVVIAIGLPLAAWTWRRIDTATLRRRKRHV
jgi:hypothetical protein